MLGFSLILIVIALILMIQQYSRHAVFSIGNIMFDVKQYASLIAALISYLAFRKRQKVSDIQ